ncbi:MAG: ubiquitin-like domain-containing protein [Chloroflexota bacterium]
MTKIKSMGHLAILTLLISLIAAFWVIGSKDITIVMDGESQQARVFAFSMQGGLIDAEIDLIEEDTVVPALDSPLHEGEEIVIARASQIVILADGEMQTLVTSDRNPLAILALAGIELGEEDLLLADGSPIAVDKRLTPTAAHSLQVRRATTINLETNGNTETIRSTAASLGAALWDAGIQLYQSDSLSPAPATPLEGGTIQASLIRSEEITIRVQGKTLSSRTTAATVGVALAEAGLPLQGLDYSIPDENAPIPGNHVIQIVRMREETALETSPLPFDVSFQALPEVPIDTQQVVQVGEYGLQAQRVRILYEAKPDAEGWEEVSREVEDEWVAREPTPRIAGYGTKIKVQTVATDDGPIEYWRAITAYATSYAPCLFPDGCSYITYSGKTLTKGIVAVLRSWYYYMGGARVYIPGYGFGEVADIGGGIAGKDWIDLGYDDDNYVGWHSNVTVYFLTPIPPNIMYILD